MDNYTPFAGAPGKPPSNGSGSQGDGGSQGAGAPGVPPSGLAMASANGQPTEGDFPTGDSARQTLW